MQQKHTRRVIRTWLILFLAELTNDYSPSYFKKIKDLSQAAGRQERVTQNGLRDFLRGDLDVVFTFRTCG